MVGWILATLMVLSDVTSDLLMSRGMKQVGAGMELNYRNILRLPALALRNASTLGAIAFSAIHFFAFLALLSFWDLSFVVPLGALVFVVGAAAARLVLGETITPVRWIGIFMIAAGVAIISAS